MSKRVFVSYSRRDSEVVLSYVDSLRGKGVQPWIDQTGIDGAADWSEKIVEAIRVADLVIVMCSPSSVASRNVAREVALATEEGKRLLPVFLAPTQIPSSLRYHIAGIQHIDGVAKDVETVTGEIMRALQDPVPVIERPMEMPALTRATAALPAVAAPLPPELLAKIEGRLALSLGPIAKVLVRNAARAESQKDALVHALAEQIPTPREKTDFVTFCQRLQI